MLSILRALKGESTTNARTEVKEGGVSGVEASFAYGDTVSASGAQHGYEQSTHSAISGINAGVDCGAARSEVLSTGHVHNQRHHDADICAEGKQEEVFRPYTGFRDGSSVGCSDNAAFTEEGFPGRISNWFVDDASIRPGSDFNSLPSFVKVHSSDGGDQDLDGKAPSGRANANSTAELGELSVIERTDICGIYVKQGEEHEAYPAGNLEELGCDITGSGSGRYNSGREGHAGCAVSTLSVDNHAAECILGSCRIRGVCICSAGNHPIGIEHRLADDKCVFGGGQQDNSSECDREGLGLQRDNQFLKEIGQNVLSADGNSLNTILCGEPDSVTEGCHEQAAEASSGMHSWQEQLFEDRPGNRRSGVLGGCDESGSGRPVHGKDVCGLSDWDKECREAGVHIEGTNGGGCSGKGSSCPVEDDSGTINKVHGEHQGVTRKNSDSNRAPGCNSGEHLQTIDEECIPEPDADRQTEGAGCEGGRVLRGDDRQGDLGSWVRMVADRLDDDFYIETPEESEGETIDYSSQDEEEETRNFQVMAARGAELLNEFELREEIKSLRSLFMKTKMTHPNLTGNNLKRYMETIPHSADTIQEVLKGLNNASEINSTLSAVRGAKMFQEMKAYIAEFIEDTTAEGLESEAAGALRVFADYLHWNVTRAEVKSSVKPLLTQVGTVGRMDKNGIYWMRPGVADWTQAGLQSPEAKGYLVINNKRESGREWLSHNCIDASIFTPNMMGKMIMSSIGARGSGGFSCVNAIARNQYMKIDGKWRFLTDYELKGKLAEEITTKIGENSNSYWVLKDDRIIKPGEKTCTFQKMRKNITMIGLSSEA